MPSLSQTAPPALLAGLRWRTPVLHAFWIAACAAGAAASLGPLPATDPALRNLLLLMAALKAATAVGAGWLVDWRLRAPIRPAFVGAYAAAVALMAAAQAMLWHPIHLVAAGILFHTGLFGLLGTAYLDRDGVAEPCRAALARRRP